MKNTWLTIAIIGACTACAWAGDDISSSTSSNETSHTWSSRHLSATGRSSDQSVRASQLRGASITDSSGARIGQIQDLIVNPSSGRIDFAVISLSGQGGASSPSGSSYGTSSQNQQYGNQATAGTGTSTAGNSGTETESSTSLNTSSSSGKMVPVPWSLLKPASGSEQYASSSHSPQSFKLSVDQSRLSEAPAIERGNWSDVGQSEWRQRINSYYGVSESASGAAESPAGTQKGHEAEKLMENQNP